MDKKPYDRDIFLEGCNHTIKRYEFEVEDAEIIILEKKYQEKTIKNLYIHEENLYKAINHHLYQVSICLLYTSHMKTIKSLIKNLLTLVRNF